MATPREGQGGGNIQRAGNCVSRFFRCASSLGQSGNHSSGNQISAREQISREKISARELFSRNLPIAALFVD